MKCEEFLKRWHERSIFSVFSLSFWIHRIRCKKCKNTILFFGSLSEALKDEKLKKEDEIFFEKMRQELLAEAQKMLASFEEEVYPKKKGLQVLKFAPALLAMAVVFSLMFFIFPKSKSKYEVSFSDLFPGGEAVILSQLDEKEMKILEQNVFLEGDVTSIYPVAPWSEVMDSLRELSPKGIEALMNQIKSTRFL